MRAHDENDHKEFILYQLDAPGSFATWFPGDVIVAVRGPVARSFYTYQIPVGPWQPEDVMQMLESTGDGWLVVEWERLKLHNAGCPPLVEYHPCGHLGGGDLG